MIKKEELPELKAGQYLVSWDGHLASPPVSFEDALCYASQGRRCNVMIFRDPENPDAVFDKDKGLTYYNKEWGLPPVVWELSHISEHWRQ